jgi:hypothetical protein
MQYKSKVNQTNREDPTICLIEVCVLPSESYVSIVEDLSDPIKVYSSQFQIDFFPLFTKMISFPCLEAWSNLHKLMTITAPWWLTSKPFRSKASRVTNASHELDITTKYSRVTQL